MKLGNLYPESWKGLPGSVCGLSRRALWQAVGGESHFRASLLQGNVWVCACARACVCINICWQLLRLGDAPMDVLFLGYFCSCLEIFITQTFKAGSTNIDDRFPLSRQVTELSYPICLRQVKEVARQRRCQNVWRWQSLQICHSVCAQQHMVPKTTTVQKGYREISMHEGVSLNS